MAYNKEYYQKNKAKFNRSTKKYRRKNRERTNELRMIRYYKNKLNNNKVLTEEEIAIKRQKRREYYEKNKVKDRAYRKKWIALNYSYYNDYLYTSRHPDYKKYLHLPVKERVAILIKDRRKKRKNRAIIYARKTRMTKTLCERVIKEPKWLNLYSGYTKAEKKRGKIKMKNRKYLKELVEKELRKDI